MMKSLRFQILAALFVATACLESDVAAAAELDCNNPLTIRTTEDLSFCARTLQPPAASRARSSRPWDGLRLRPAPQWFHDHLDEFASLCRIDPNDLLAGLPYPEVVAVPNSLAPYLKVGDVVVWAIAALKQGEIAPLKAKLTNLEDGLERAWAGSKPFKVAVVRREAVAEMAANLPASSRWCLDFREITLPRE